MQDITGSFSVKTLGGAFGVSRAGYYRWRHRQRHPSQRQLGREKLDFLVAQAFAARKERNGAPGYTRPFS